jgi:DNA-directed RNA polymerase specialized sigma24 family protein
MPLLPRIALPLTREKFKDLLNWLNSDSEVAGKVYTDIQNGLIGMFAARGFSDPESLADDVINRVADRLPTIGPGYQGKPVHYFRGVARNVAFEAGRRKEIATDTLPEYPTKEIEVTDEYNCLLKCLQFLPAHERDFILDYHVYDGADKIASHEVMAKEKGVSVGTLRVQAHRLRVRLEKCVLECVQKLQRNENSNSEH